MWREFDTHMQYRDMVSLHRVGTCYLRAETGDAIIPDTTTEFV